MDWMTYARSLIGVREIRGPKHSGTIMGWIKALGAGKLGVTVRDDETAPNYALCEPVGI